MAAREAATVNTKNGALSSERRDSSPGTNRVREKTSNGPAKSSTSTWSKSRMPTFSLSIARPPPRCSPLTAAPCPRARSTRPPAPVSAVAHPTQLPHQARGPGRVLEILAHIERRIEIRPDGDGAVLRNDRRLDRGVLKRLHDRPGQFPGSRRRRGDQRGLALEERAGLVRQEWRQGLQGGKRRRIRGMTMHDRADVRAASVDGRVEPPFYGRAQ